MGGDGSRVEPHGRGEGLGMFCLAMEPEGWVCMFVVIVLPLIYFVVRLSQFFSWLARPTRCEICTSPVKDNWTKVEKDGRSYIACPRCTAGIHAKVSASAVSQFLSNEDANPKSPSEPVMLPIATPDSQLLCTCEVCKNDVDSVSRVMLDEQSMLACKSCQAVIRKQASRAAVEKLMKQIKPPADEQ